MKDKDEKKLNIIPEEKFNQKIQKNLNFKNSNKDNNNIKNKEREKDKDRDRERDRDKDTNSTHDDNDPNSSAFLDKVKEKLEILSERQIDSQKYFKKREAIDNKLKQLESNLKKKVFMENNIITKLNEKTLDKISDFLKKINNMDKDIINLIDRQKQSIKIQTEEDNENIYLRNKIENLENYIKKIKEKKLKLKAEIKEIKIENQNLTENYISLKKQNDILKKEFSKIIEINKELEDQNNKFKLRNEEFIHNDEKCIKIVKEYNELKSAMEDFIKIDKEKCEFEEIKRGEINDFKKKNINLILNLDILNEVSQFLNVKDIGNLMQLSKDFNESFKNNKKCVQNYFHYLLQNYKKKINKLEKNETKNEYKINNEEIEKLFKLYINYNYNYDYFYFIILYLIIDYN
jgi:hypothetical protein